MTLRTQLTGMDAAKALVHDYLDLVDRVKPIVGETVERQIEDRIDREKASPSGAPWARRLPASIRRANGRPLLERSGRLLGSIASTPTATGVRVGSALPYAARQNRRRPFIGLSAENVRELRELVVRIAEAA